MDYKDIEIDERCVYCKKKVNFTRTGTRCNDCFCKIYGIDVDTLKTLSPESIRKLITNKGLITSIPYIWVLDDIKEEE